MLFVMEAGIGYQQGLVVWFPFKANRLIYIYGVSIHQIAPQK